MAPVIQAPEQVVAEAIQNKRYAPIWLMPILTLDNAVETVADPVRDWKTKQRFRRQQLR